MQLTREAIREFAEIYAQDHPGETIGGEQLLEMASRFLSAIALVYPIAGKNAGQGKTQKGYISKTNKTNKKSHL